MIELAVMLDLDLAKSIPYSVGDGFEGCGLD